MSQEGKEVRNSNSAMLNQCNAVVQGYKKVQEELFSVSKDRLRLIEELKEATDQALQMLEENQQLKKIVSTMQELNTALTHKYENLEKQVKQLSKGDNFKESIQGLSQDYDSMLTANSEMQKQMSQLGEVAAKIEELSLPIRVIKVAFTSNKNLRELVMRQAEQQLGVNEELRQIFFACSFDIGEAVVL